MMRTTNNIDLMVMASLMPTPDGVLLIAAMNGTEGGRPTDSAAGAADPFDAVDGGLTATGWALMVSAMTLLVGGLALMSPLT